MCGRECPAVIPPTPRIRRTLVFSAGSFAAHLYNEANDKR